MTVIARIERRAREFSRFSHLEGLQIVRYQVRTLFPPFLDPLNQMRSRCQQGQKYSQHTDWFFGKGSAAAIGRDGQRAATIFVYLNDVTVEDGGETDFPKVNALKVASYMSSQFFFYEIVFAGETEKKLGCLLVSFLRLFFFLPSDHVSTGTMSSRTERKIPMRFMPV